jgi:hypothetical protein
MPTWLWVVIAVVAALIVVMLIWSALRSRRTRALKRRFGPEYDRVTSDASSRREAETELAEREERREQFDVRPLDPERQAHYTRQWQEMQSEFVDDPGGSVAGADRLIRSVMQERGYPVDDFDTRAADLSTDHPEVVEHYRIAHGIAVSHETGDADTEDLRRAIQHYRLLFTDLVQSRSGEEVRT